MKLSKINKSTFEFMDAKFTIKNLLSGEILSISDSSNSATIELKDVGGEFLPTRTIASSQKKEKFLTIQKCVVDWSGVFGEDEKGNEKEIECTEQNKKRFCEELDLEIFNDFYAKLTQEREKLAKVVKEQREKTVKN